MWSSLCFLRSYHRDHTTGPDAITETHHALVVGVLAPPQEVLLTHVVGTVVDHEAAALHPAGVTPAQVGGHVRTVAAGLIGATLEVLVLVEDDLKNRTLVYLVYSSKLKSKY